MAQELGIEVALWGREQTAKEGPFTELLAFDILINAINVRDPIAPYPTFGTITDSDDNS